jgi:hypothetical protein
MTPGKVKEYLLLGGQSEPLANAVRTGCYKVLPPTLISALSKAQNALQKLQMYWFTVHWFYCQLKVKWTTIQQKERGKSNALLL